MAEVERYLALAASQYRRSHDVFGEISAGWAYVTLYYGAFYASSALMGLFGLWLGSKRVLAVSQTNPTRQQFDVKPYKSPSGAGSHARFWELFYNEMPALKHMLSPAECAAVVAPGSGFAWQIQERNRLNYDTFEAVDLARQFVTFSSAGFPGTLPGVLATQYQFLETVLGVSWRFARAFGLNTDALDSICSLPTSKDRVHELVLRRSPRKLGARAKRRLIHG